jgi:hypothetical protein
MKWQLFKCNLSIFGDKYLIGIVVLGGLIYYIDNIWVRIVFGLLILHLIYQSMREIFLK